MLWTLTSPGSEDSNYWRLMQEIMFPILNVVSYSPGWKKLLCFVEFKWISIFVLPDWKWRKLFPWEFRNMLCLSFWTVAQAYPGILRKLCWADSWGVGQRMPEHDAQCIMRPFLGLPALSGGWRTVVKCNEPSVTTRLPRGLRPGAEAGTERGRLQACSASACQLSGAWDLEQLT